MLPRLSLMQRTSVSVPSQITAVISAHNDNSKPYNLTAIVASLNSPMDFSMYIQNFTHRVSSWLQLGHTSSCLCSTDLVGAGLGRTHPLPRSAHCCCNTTL